MDAAAAAAGGTIARSRFRPSDCGYPSMSTCEALG
jgi:hypothetical protein